MCLSVSVFIWLVSIFVDWYLLQILLLFTAGWYPIYYMFLHIAMLCAIVLFIYISSLPQLSHFLELAFQIALVFPHRVCYISGYLSLRYCLTVIGVTPICLLLQLTTQLVFESPIVYDLLLWL